MKSPELKNIFIAAGMAVFASVFAIGVNAAFGVSAPTVSPEAAGLVGPTFSDVTATGDVSVGGTISDPDDGTVNVDDTLATAGILSTGDISTSASITATGSLTAADVTATDDLSVVSDASIMGNASITGTISSPATTGTNPNGNVRINDTVVVTGDSWVSGESWLTGMLHAGIINASGVATANRFGTYARLQSTIQAIPAGEHRTATATCPSGSYMVSCGFLTDDSATMPESGYTRFITITKINPQTSTNSCVIGGYNTHASGTRYMRPYANCLYPGF